MGTDGHYRDSPAKGDRFGYLNYIENAELH